MLHFDMLHVHWHLVLWSFLSNWNVKFHCHLCPSFSAVSFVGCRQVCCCRRYSIITSLLCCCWTSAVKVWGGRYRQKVTADTFLLALTLFCFQITAHAILLWLSLSRQLSSDKGQVFLCISIHFLPLMQLTLTQIFSKLFLATFSDSFYAQMSS